MTEFEQKSYDELRKKCKAYEDDNKLLRDLLREFSEIVTVKRNENKED